MDNLILTSRQVTSKPRDGYQKCIPKVQSVPVFETIHSFTGLEFYNLSRTYIVALLRQFYIAGKLRGTASVGQGRRSNNTLFAYRYIHTCASASNSMHAYRTASKYFIGYYMPIKVDIIFNVGT